MASSELRLSRGVVALRVRGAQETKAFRVTVREGETLELRRAAPERSWGVAIIERAIFG